MSESIWKFPVQLADEFEIELDVDAEVLSVQNQPGLGPQMWVRTRVYDVPRLPKGVRARRQKLC